MEEFIEEVKNIPTNELIIIIEDQEELYTKEEFEILKKELAERKEINENSKTDLINEVMEGAVEETIKAQIREEKELREREIRQKLEKAKKEKEMLIKRLKENGLDEYCEYKILKIADSRSGFLNEELLEEKLNYYALEGWRVKTAYTNELGKNSHSSGIGGISAGINSTCDEHIIILERIVKIKEI